MQAGHQPPKETLKRELKAFGSLRKPPQESLCPHSLLPLFLARASDLDLALGLFEGRRLRSLLTASVDNPARENPHKNMTETTRLKPLTLQGDLSAAKELASGRANSRPAIDELRRDPQHV